MFTGLNEYICQNLQSKVTEMGLNDYSIFGKVVEEPVSDLIEEFLNKKEISFKPTRAPRKNDFPDLELLVGDEEYALEHKAGVSARGPSNDLGTLNAYPDKISKFDDRIFCVFVKYSEATKGNGIIVDNVYFDKIYKFIGNFPSSKRTDILKYRKKDGNLRPKKWSDFEDQTIYTHSLKQFQEHIEATISYRAAKLVEQHLKDLTEKDTMKIYNNLKQKIENKQ